MDRRFDLGTRDANVPQCAIVELAKGCDGGTTGEMARDPIPTGAENLENVFALFVTSGRTIIARVADMLVSNGCSGAMQGRRRKRLSRRS